MARALIRLGSRPNFFRIRPTFLALRAVADAHRMKKFLRDSQMVVGLVMARAVDWAADRTLADSCVAASAVAVLLVPVVPLASETDGGGERKAAEA